MVHPPPKTPRTTVLREAPVFSTLGCVVSCHDRLNGSGLKDICPVKTVVLFSENNNPPSLPPSPLLVSHHWPITFT